MTKDTFVRTIKGILLSSREIRWNSLHESSLAQLGREYEGGSLKNEAVVNRLREMFGYAFDREREKGVLKALR